MYREIQGQADDMHQHFTCPEIPVLSFYMRDLHRNPNSYKAYAKAHREGGHPGFHSESFTEGHIIFPILQQRPTHCMHVAFRQPPVGSLTLHLKHMTDAPDVPALKWRSTLREWQAPILLVLLPEHRGEGRGVLGE